MDEIWSFHNSSTNGVGKIKGLLRDARHMKFIRVKFLVYQRKYFTVNHLNIKFKF